MAIDTVSSPTMPVSAAGTTTVVPRDRSTALGKDEFLTLLVAQLKNQDPLSPLQPHEFAAQLAQFTSVEQLSNLSAAFAAQQETAALAALQSTTALGASLIGKEVVAQSDLVAVDADGSTALTFEVAGLAGNAAITLYDATGQAVATKALGNVGGGRQTLAVEGLPPGTYRAELTVTSSDGTAIPVRQLVAGTVDGLHFTQGLPTLRIGGLDIALDAVVEIQSPTQE